MLSKLVAPVIEQPISCPNVSAGNTIRISVTLSYLVLLTLIIHYFDKGSNCEMAAKVSHCHHVAGSLQTYKIARDKISIDDWPPTRIVQDQGHTVRE
jgi:hypothetical protein